MVSVDVSGVGEVREVVAAEDAITQFIRLFGFHHPLVLSGRIVKWDGGQGNETWHAVFRQFVERRLAEALLEACR